MAARQPQGSIEGSQKTTKKVAKSTPKGGQSAAYKTIFFKKKNIKIFRIKKSLNWILEFQEKNVFFSEKKSTKPNWLRFGCFFCCIWLAPGCFRLLFGWLLTVPSPFIYVLAACCLLAASWVLLVKTLYFSQSKYPKYRTTQSNADKVFFGHSSISFWLRPGCLLVCFLATLVLNRLLVAVLPAFGCLSSVSWETLKAFIFFW